jgi:cytochrome P450
MPTLPFDRPHPLRPPPAYADLPPVTRVHAPAGPWSDGPGGSAWLVTGFDAVATVLTDPAFGLDPPGGVNPDNHTLFQDGEPHARLRRLVARAFTPRRIARLSDRMHADATRLVTRMLDAGPSADLVVALSAPLSIGVLGGLLGVADQEIRHFHDTVGAALITEDGWERMQAFAVELVAAKRTTPDDGLISSLITTRDADDGRMTDDELVAMVTVLVAVAYLPVTYGIAIGAMILLDHGRLAELADPHRRGGAVEELLRHQAGLGAEPFPRWARADTTLAGTPIARGEQVLVRLEAAHRDPDRFPDPHTFDPDRGTPHMAFGRGPHHCLGAALARLGMAAALGALAERIPTLRMAVPVEDVEWQRHHLDTFPTAVPVAW